jgi:mannosyl-glycoprotein endo-beta-N-acetylglucosaminidase
LGNSTANKGVEVPKAPRRKGRDGEELPECPHGPFRPLIEFFDAKPPPDPFVLPVWTCFCPGVGRGWWVNGSRVMNDGGGWTDLDKQCSLGDLVWPVPVLQLEGKGEWEDEGEESSTDDKDLPEAKSEICMSDAWNGGSSLRLRLSAPPPGPDTDSVSERVVYRNFWIPIQSLGLTRGKTYEASLVYKLESREHQEFGLDIDIDVGLSVKALFATDPSEFEISTLAIQDSESSISGGWTRLRISFIAGGDPQAIRGTTGAVGLNITVLAETLTQWHALSISLLLGQLCVYPMRPVDIEVYEPMILWADITPQVPNSSIGRHDGTITWETSIAFPNIPNSAITSPDDPVSVFKVPIRMQEYRWFPSFMYFNIYALIHPASGVGIVVQPEDAVWIGTSGGTTEGRKRAFVVAWKNLKTLLGMGEDGRGRGKVRFYVQGVTDRGVVLGWERCVYVDVDVDWDV